jgi:hypothetical protein
MIELPFILLCVCGVEICVGGGEKSEEECGGWMERWSMDDTKLGRTKTVVAAPVRRLVMKSNRPRHQGTVR